MANNLVFSRIWFPQWISKSVFYIIWEQQNINIEYFDSKDNLMVQVSDFFSNLYFSYLKNKSTYEILINKLKKGNYIKDIFYYPNKQ